MTPKLPAKPSRTKLRLQAELDTTKRIRGFTQIDEDEFFELEVDCGIELLDLYLSDVSEEQRIQWKAELLHEPIHNYWPWLVNQKRAFDFEFARAYGLLNGFPVDSLWSPEMIRSNYYEELSAWTRREEILDRLRHFINQSETLFA